MKIAALALATLLAAAFSLDTGAQGYSRRGGNRDSPAHDKSDTEKDKHPVPDDPFSALARELPSLRIDLGLASSQIEAWNVFERSVRDIAEMNNVRRRHLAALREAGENPPGALAIVATVAEDDRLRAEATQELRSRIGALYDRLEDGQKRLFDKRVLQSQTEPLGR